MAIQNSSSPNRETLIPSEDETEQLLARAVMRLNGNILGLVIGIISGLALFIATNFLILKGGDVVGPHLALLRAFLPFYSVTFIGSLIGLVYGFVCGYIAGLIVASLYNLVVTLKNR